MATIYNQNSIMELRRTLRKDSTEAEKILWKYLRGSNFPGYRFRRQYSVDSFILDFYCPRARLAIEIDGEYHNNDEVKEYDKARQEYIEDLGIRFIRFDNQEILNKINDVLSNIKKNLKIVPLSLNKERGQG
ncbi:MAG: hypothetical protein A3J65_03100 [Candidatus Buchananbacteria bacterium RIFCSPHIGHO2_02_FULL_45_11b]|uniref:DUF559 domain-containing protein n=4 Tax=Candidatus Buchananiibacteriota TaxID=1817903 RepID=A0A1G1YPB6_9BACT|nr:MAG: hypothetical protein A2663_04645 [Candidatus Buchananbacteria bacterium RIFCSPHIGHO2_01_FULL_46_12]OGY50915.1 MAG: hypothetical protein A3J65_03100 [Candidatus Buchananbacteria bacterium RIFCSPHIGHO2_02_FULL_45_11b]OGY54144.1 MAG: hypothetical protein A3B15_01185 [Candidatus Buchananbacteria bacterium RIFCSPLOWO2_01_FULL_45_31]OGY56628.1 MAG: hypothetical protein A3H67_04880 [Candidatus Buchananbacteria bacterium RIFCSPLOWO2_02_FULL_46_11b]